MCIIHYIFWWRTGSTWTPILDLRHSGWNRFRNFAGGAVAWPALESSDSIDDKTFACAAVFQESFCQDTFSTDAFVERGRGSYWKVVRKDIYLSYYSPSVYTLDFPNMLRSISNVWFISRSMQSNSDFPLRSPIPTTCIRHAMFQSMLFYSHFCAHSSPMPVPGTVPPTMQTCRLHMFNLDFSFLLAASIYIYII